MHPDALAAGHRRAQQLRLEAAERLRTLGLIEIDDDTLVLLRKRPEKMHGQPPHVREATSMRQSLALAEIFHAAVGLLAGPEAQEPEPEAAPEPRPADIVRPPMTPLEQLAQFEELSPQEVLRILGPLSIAAIRDVAAVLAPDLPSDVPKAALLRSLCLAIGTGDREAFHLGWMVDEIERAYPDRGPAVQGEAPEAPEPDHTGGPDPEPEAAELVPPEPDLGDTEATPDPEPQAPAGDLFPDDAAPPEIPPIQPPAPDTAEDREIERSISEAQGKSLFGRRRKHG